MAFVRLAAIAEPWQRAEPYLDGRFPRQTPGSGSSGAWTVEPAFPDLVFEDITVLSSAPKSERLFVGSQRGLVVSIDPREPDPATRPFLDLHRRVRVARHGGFLGMAFHPEFNDPASPHRGFLYVYYTAPGPFLRLARFELPDGAEEVDPASEQIMLEVRLTGRSHRGGGMTFGNDGFLYLSIGDQYQYETAQNIVDTLEGGILRIDVDRDPNRSHPPRRRFPLSDPEERSGIGYWIPNDNPFLDAAGGVFEEYFALGNRNTHRLTNDPLTGRLWFADVGQWRREEVNILERGANYGWPFREGTISGEHAPPAVIRGELKEPLLDFQRGEAASIIGGYVYRGSEHPALWGKYLCGDYMTHRIWAVTVDDEGRAEKELLTTFHAGGLSTFGVDARGEPYLAGMGRQPLFRLARRASSAPEPPRRLSELGVFTNLETLEIHPAFLPYELNQPSWTDGAVKRRWVSVPASSDPHASDDEGIRFSRKKPWHFPVGTVFVKHFEMPFDERRPEGRHRLETRFLVHGQDGRYYGLTYKWRHDGSDADLLNHGAREDLTVQTAEGRLAMEWVYPSRSDCMSCHLPSAGFVLGVNTLQLNRMGRNPIDGSVENQLVTWDHFGLFTPPLPAGSVSVSESVASIDDETISLALRVQAYLDANCAYCHQPGGPVATAFDLRYATPLAEKGLIEGEVAEGMGLVDSRLVAPGDVRKSMLFLRMAGLGPESMPPVPHGRVDRTALSLISRWIESLDEDGGDPTGDDDGMTDLRLEPHSSGVWLSFHRPVGSVRLDEMRWQSSPNLDSWELVEVNPESASIHPISHGRMDVVRVLLEMPQDQLGRQFFRFYQEDDPDKRRSQ